MKTFEEQVRETYSSWYARKIIESTLEWRNTAKNFISKTLRSQTGFEGIGEKVVFNSTIGLPALVIFDEMNDDRYYAFNLNSIEIIS